MSEVVHIKRKPKQLTKTYHPDAPYEVEREDDDDGTIRFFVSDTRPDSFRLVCATSDHEGDNPNAKHDAEQIARGLNMLVQYAMEKLPNTKAAEDDENEWSDA